MKTAQNLRVTRDYLLAATTTRAMLIELAVETGAFTPAGAQQMADATMRKPSKLVANLDCPKLRTSLIQKFEVMYPEFTTNGFVYNPVAEAEPEMDIGKAGANNKRKATASKLTGEYEVVKKAGNAEADEGKWAIWQHVWACTSFEDYFAKAPAKSVTKTNRVITAASEIGWALKSGWIKPVVKGEEAQA